MGKELPKDRGQTIKILMDVLHKKNQELKFLRKYIWGIKLNQKNEQR